MPSRRSKLAHTAVASLSQTAALAVLGGVLAYWTWAWCAPSVVPPIVDMATPTAQLTAARNLFGQAPGNAHAAAPSALAITLLGVMAARPPDSGYALLRLDAGKTRLVRAGDNLAPGIRVEQVLPQEVILQRHGVRETLAWPQPAKASVTSPGVPAR
jgi:general secretion pathway protein C